VTRDDSPCILVADDAADMRAYIKRLLGGRWRVEVVGNGVEALSFLRRRPADLVIADVMMPTLDGFALLRELRANAHTRDVPVLMLSARAGEESRIEGLQAGANDYLVKPFSARELVARVEAQLLRAEVHAIEAAHNRRLGTIFAHAPVAMALLKGPHVFDSPTNLPADGESAADREIGPRRLPGLENQGPELLDPSTSGAFLADSMRIRVNRGPDGTPEDAFSSSSTSRVPAVGWRHCDRRDGRHRSGERRG
jgi:CheY-like chemotaxis protein